MQRFAKQEVMELTGTTSNQLQSFERSGLVIPIREWNDRLKPDVFYSLNQVLALNVIVKVKHLLSAKEIKRLAAYIQEHGLHESLRNKFLIFCGNNINWVDKGESIKLCHKLCHSNSIKIIELLPEVWAIPAVVNHALHLK